ncbi:ATP-binding protein [Amycolatopsis sp. lyj-346]|uniref:ATP-binding protein n=1 Tax=Amycolatopsis sp. lyj-346 TaxID=2789289 RepID=UPI003977F47E
MQEAEAEARQATTLRDIVAAWAAGCGLAADLVEDLRLTVYEAMSNVVAHAYPAGVVGSMTLAAARHESGARRDLRQCTRPAFPRHNLCIRPVTRRFNRRARMWWMISWLRSWRAGAGGGPAADRRGRPVGGADRTRPGRDRDSAGS